MTDFLHTNEPEFRAALEFTTAETGFQPALIEKDYFCSLVLAGVVKIPNLPLVFKGGTLLNKAYVGFYRLSEDLDFTIPTSSDSARTERSRIAKTVGNALEQITAGVPGLTITEPLCGFNNSTQYRAMIGYASVVGSNGVIQFEVSQREPVVLGVEKPMLRTLMVDAVSGEAAVPPFAMPALSMREAYAEKVRAALTRRDAAIRDLFDIDHASRDGILDFTDPTLLPLIASKIRLPGNEIVALDEVRAEGLRQQLETGLRPVLRAKDFRAFNFDQALANLRELQEDVRAALDQPSA